MSDRWAGHRHPVQWDTMASCGGSRELVGQMALDGRETYDLGCSQWMRGYGGQLLDIKPCKLVFKFLRHLLNCQMWTYIKSACRFDHYFTISLFHLIIISYQIYSPLWHSSLNIFIFQLNDETFSVWVWQYSSLRQGEVVKNTVV